MRVTSEPPRLFAYDLVFDVCILTLLVTMSPAILVFVAVVLALPSQKLARAPTGPD
jgi:hypothetical protein